MDRNIIKTLFKALLFGGIIALIIIGLFSSMSGNPSGTFFQGSGSSNSGYISHLNIEVTKLEREKAKVPKDFIMSLSSLSLIIGGAITVLLSYIL